MISNLPADVKLIKWPNLIYDDNGWPCQNKIEELKSHRLVVINCSSEHWGELACRQLDDQLKDTGLNFLLLSHNPRDHLLTPRIIFYPNWYYWARENFVFPTDPDINNQRQYKLSCLNANPRPHRILNYLLLKRKAWANNMLISFHRNYELGQKRGDLELSPEILAEWNDIQHALPDREGMASFLTKQPRIDSIIDHPAYTDSYIHLVTETAVDRILFVTEKTWKPIAMGQLFVVLGSMKIIAHLRSQGVDVFDDIIDHDYYDSEPDPTQRIYKIHKVLDYLMTQNLPALYQQTQQRREANVKKFLAGEFVDPQYIDAFNTKTQ